VLFAQVENLVEDEKECIKNLVEPPLINSCEKFSSQKESHFNQKYQGGAVQNPKYEIKYSLASSSNQKLSVQVVQACGRKGTNIISVYKVTLCFIKLIVRFSQITVVRNVV
jgi:hypothetical protein